MVDRSRGAGTNDAGGTLTLVRTRVCKSVQSSIADRQITGIEKDRLVEFGTCIESECELCVTTEPSDLDFDGRVDRADMTILLRARGNAGPEDLDGIGIVNGGDLAKLLPSWS